MTIPKRFQGIVSIGEGREYMIIMQNYWGRGLTLLDAIKEVRKSSHRDWHSPSTECVVYDVPDGAWVNDMGGICWDRESEVERPRKIADYIKREAVTA